jgi:GumC protein
VVTAEMRTQEFFQTQVELLQNNALARRVIETLDLTEHPVVKEMLFSDKKPGPMARFKGMLKDGVNSLIDKLKPKDQKTIEQTPLFGKESLKERTLLGFLSENLEVSPRRNTMIIGVEFVSPDRRLSQQIINAYTQEFVNWNMEKKLEASRLAREFLMKQIDRFKPICQTGRDRLSRFEAQQCVPSARRAELGSGRG